MNRTLTSLFMTGSLRAILLRFGFSSSTSKGVFLPYSFGTRPICVRKEGGEIGIRELRKDHLQLSFTIVELHVEAPQTNVKQSAQIQTPTYEKEIPSDSKKTRPK